MFEQSLLGTSGRERRRGRWIALGSVVVQAAILTGFVVGPLLYPATMPAYKMAEMKTVSLVPVKPPVVVRKPVVVREASSAAAPASEVRQVARGSAVAALRPALGNDETPKLIAVGDGGGMGSHTVPGLAAGTGPGNGPVVVAKAAAPPARLNISSGVSAGLLLTPLRPVYPEIAKIAHVSGTVVVTATIDKSGRIVGLQVLSGPVMLQKAAVDAVRDARYRPYLLNGQPVEVITTFSVNFVMGAG
jgi:protein TonB